MRLFIGFAADPVSHREIRSISPAPAAGDFLARGFKRQRSHQKLAISLVLAYYLLQVACDHHYLTPDDTPYDRHRERGLITLAEAAKMFHSRRSGGVLALSGMYRLLYWGSRGTAWNLFRRRRPDTSKEAVLRFKQALTELQANGNSAILLRGRHEGARTFPVQPARQSGKPRSMRQWKPPSTNWHLVRLAPPRPSNPTSRSMSALAPAYVGGAFRSSHFWRWPMARRQSQGSAMQAAMEKMFSELATEEQKQEHAKLSPEEQNTYVRAFVMGNAGNPDPKVQRELDKVIRSGYRQGWYSTVGSAGKMPTSKAGHVTHALTKLLAECGTKRDRQHCAGPELRSRADTSASGSRPSSFASLAIRG